MAGTCRANGPVEANSLAKRVKRVAFGITNWPLWRVRALLYAGKPDWSKLATITSAAPRTYEEPVTPLP